MATPITRTPGNAWDSLGFTKGNQFTTNLGINNYADEAFVRSVFNRFDADRNGWVDQSELRNLLVSCGKNPSNDQIIDLLNEIDQNQDGKISFNEFYVIVKQMQSGQFMYVQAPVVVQQAPGRSAPPVINDINLTQRGQYQRRGVDANAFGASIQQLRQIDDEERLRQNNLLANLRGKIGGIQTGVDVRGQVGELNQTLGNTRNEHSILLSENQRLVNHNNRLIQYVSEFELKQSEYINRIRDLELAYQRVKIENEDLRHQVQFDQVEIQRESRRISELEFMNEQINMEFLTVSNQADAQRVQIEQFWDLMNREQDALKARLTGFLQGNVRDRYVESTQLGNRDISKQELQRRIMTTTINFCARVEENDIVFDKYAARQCATQILTNAYRFTYSSAVERLDANNNFESAWAQTQKHTDGNLHKEHYNAFFRTVLERSIPQE